jgi:aryl-alcohol dehydrogenase-like predicted oxidoreductase
LGQATGKSEEESIAVVRRALELGVNFIDTAEAYGTETIVGKALAGVPRDQVVISTKKNVFRQGELVGPDAFVAGVEGCLQRLGVDFVDVFHLHGVRPQHYDHARTQIVPAVLRLQEQGLIRHLGITESFGEDTRHAMLARALDDPWWDVMMVGFNLLNQTARARIFARSQAQAIGVLIMFAVRRTLSDPAKLAETMQTLASAGQIDPAHYDAQAPLDFLIHTGGAASLTEAAYRYCRYEPGVHVVLSGTGNAAHLEDNARALLQPPLPAADVARVNRLFAAVDSVSGN